MELDNFTDITDISNSTENGNDYYDEDYDDQEEIGNMDIFFLNRMFLLIPALSITTLMMFMEKRKRLCPRCCKGYYALIIPVNFLENKSNRWTILSAFSIIIVDILALIFEKDALTLGMHPLAKVLIRILLVLMTCFLCFPFLFCFTVGTYFSLILGILYALLYIAIMLLENILAHENPEKELTLVDAVDSFSAELIIIGSGILMLYGYMKKIYRKCTHKDYEKSDILNYQKQYIKTILRSQTSNETELKNGPKAKCVQCFQKRIYNKVVGFRYSLSLLVSICVGLVSLSYIFLEFGAKTVYTYLTLKTLLESQHEDLRTFAMPNIVQFLSKIIFKTAKHKSSDWKMTVYDFIDEQIAIIFGSVLAAIITAYFLTFFNALHMLKSFRENLLSLHRRKLNENLLQMKEIKPVKLVLSAVQYGGYQVAYIIWGAHLQMIFLIFVYIVLSEIIILPFKYSFWSVLWSTFEKIYPIVIVMILIKGTQYVLIRFVFLQEKGTLLALDNRKGFYIMMYIMFFYNIFMGLFSCILRILKATIFGLWFISRLDRSVFPRTFEHFDSGFKAYTCLLKLEALQSNPILVTFVNILNQTKKCPKAVVDEEECNDVTEQHKLLTDRATAMRRHVARNRWYVAYTLIRNPDLKAKRGLQPPETEIEYESCV